MPAGSSPKRERQYKHIKASEQGTEQLYQEAKRKNVSGRSKMTRAELERAVSR